MIEKLIIFLLSTSIIWVTYLPSIDIGPISIFPLRVLVFLFILFFIIFLLVHKKIYLDKLNIYTVSLFLLILVKSMLSLYWSHDILKSIALMLFYFEAFAIVFICKKIITDERKLQILLVSYLINIASITLIGFFESLSGTYLFWNTTYEYLLNTKNSFGFHYPIVYFFNINDFASFITLSLPLIFMVDTRNNTVLKILKYKSVTLIVYNVIMSESRGSLLGIFFILLILSLRAIHFEIRFAKYLRAIFNKILMGVTVISPIVFLFFLKNPIDERFIIWKNTLMTFTKTLFIGVGIGNTAYVNYNSGYTNTAIFDPHNYFIEFLSDFGLISFILFIYWLYLLTLSSTETLINNDALIYILLFIIIAIVPSSMTGFYYIWFGFGIVYSLKNRNHYNKRSIVRFIS